MFIIICIKSKDVVFPITKDDHGNCATWKTEKAAHKAARMIPCCQAFEYRVVTV